MNEFINRVKSVLRQPQEVFNRLINKLMQKGEKDFETEDLEEDTYNSEILMNGKIYRGNIYIFNYTAKNPTQYSFGSESVMFTDTMPIVLVTAETLTTIRGINLNFCNMALKTLILNLVRDLDNDFYDYGGAYKLAKAKSLPISQKVYRFFSADGETLLVKHLNLMFSNVDYNGIIRNYAVSNIRNIRLIEPWQWIDLPFLNYEGSMKNDTLRAIWHISGIDKIHI